MKVSWNILLVLWCACPVQATHSEHEALLHEAGLTLERQDFSQYFDKLPIPNRRLKIACPCTGTTCTVMGTLLIKKIVQDARTNAYKV
jgi:hypothetical protein